MNNHMTLCGGGTLRAEVSVGKGVQMRMAFETRHGWRGRVPAASRIHGSAWSAPGEPSRGDCLTSL